MKFTKFKIRKAAGDYRPTTFPPKYPYWYLGETDTDYLMAAYSFCGVDLKYLWPNSYDWEMITKEIQFDEEYPCPEWYAEIIKKQYKDDKYKFVDIDLLELIYDMNNDDSISVSENNTDVVIKGNITEHIERLNSKNRFHNCSENSVINMIHSETGISYLKIMEYIKERNGDSSENKNSLF